MLVLSNRAEKSDKPGVENELSIETAQPASNIKLKNQKRSSHNGIVKLQFIEGASKGAPILKDEQVSLQKAITSQGTFLAQPRAARVVF